MDLVLEKNMDTVEDKSLVAPSLMLTPPLDGETYWVYRVQLSDEQAILAFPKFLTLGIGFKNEEDWNTNLPYTGEAGKIFQHIRRNKGSDSIGDADCIRAIEMIQAGIHASGFQEAHVPAR